MKKIIAILIAIWCAGLSAQLPKNLDQVTPFHEGLAAIQKGNHWAFIDDLGNIIINFRDDIYWNKTGETAHDDIRSVLYPKFSDGLCIVQKKVDDIPVFGFINTKGDLVIEHQFLNVRPFENGFTTGVMFEKVKRGQNEFKLDIYEYKFYEVLVDSKGNIVEFLSRRYNIQMTKKRYKMPLILSKILNDKLIAVKNEDNWELKKWNLNQSP
ncbi:WG repeat-containing protein [Flagellimonas nanhaiensis]|uniref:WG repeat-containing protein n=1 Tax=Flagellimonas nanhaiensis TaxID=2292706 RepID=A0A371JLY6_9FLAO|nr:WG repeat-containing protein [Allomuricauda nanhaiensis]RDY58033.1 WG repeat-containing protein [Allomuricauda nanhaiensis]